MTAIPTSPYDTWRTTVPLGDEWDETLDVECDNFTDEDEEHPCTFTGKVEATCWKTGRWTYEFTAECPVCQHDIRGEIEYDPT